MKRNKQIKVLDIFLILLLIMIVLIAVLISFTNKATNKSIIVFSLVLVLLMIGLGTYRYWIAYPEFKGFKAPLFLPKAVGLGWSINPRNPIGLVLIGITTIFIVSIIIYFLINGVN